MRLIAYHDHHHRPAGQGATSRMFGKKTLTPKEQGRAVKKEVRHNEVRLPPASMVFCWIGLDRSTRNAHWLAHSSP